MINYSVIFTNNSKNIIDNLDKYICSDNKIHIRFRDFNKEEFLIGFEKKLTYLLAYLLNYSFVPKLIGDYTSKEILTEFLLQKDVSKIIDFLNFYIQIDGGVKGLQIKPNYKKHQYNYKYFGNTESKFFPLYVKNNLTEVGDLQFFLNIFNLDLYNYLFNDNYIIWLHDKEFKTNKKFENKKLKKINRQNNKNNTIIELW